MTGISEIIFVAIGGAIGAAYRSLLSDSFNGKIKDFPLGTFIANIIASLLAGIMTAEYKYHDISSSLLPFIDIGFCATLSTFSSLIWELSEMLKLKKFKSALVYLFTTTFCGAFLFLLGEWGIRFMH